MNETTLRFLNAIADRVPLSRLAEVHVFPAMKQGGVETGVAVVAAVPEMPGGPPPNIEDTAPTDDLPHHSAAPDIEPSLDPPAEDPAEDLTRLPDESVITRAAAVPLATDMPVDLPVVPDGGRHTVFTARYRLNLRGPDRGKWEMQLVAEAEAPLVTVEAVVRGVQERTGDGVAPLRMTADDLRARLAAPSWE